MPNYFGSESVAARYARARPAFHHEVVARLPSLLDAPLSFERTLDVGCGTGGSTTALAQFAVTVVGVDPSLPMLRHAAVGGMYVAGRGEQLPFRPAAFDLLTVSQAFHWLDRTRFLAEAGRVLRCPGTVVVYDHYFTGEAFGTEGLENWVHSVYRKRYPTPPRAPVEFEVGEVIDGFRCRRRETFEDAVSLTQAELVDYLLTQTNVIAAIEQGGESPASVGEWLHAETARFFGTNRLTIRFRGPIWILTRVRDGCDKEGE